MGVVLVAVALVAGYIFSHQHLSSRYKLSRTDGWHSYFYVAYRGVIFSLVSAALCITIDYFDCISKLLSQYDASLSELNKLFLNTQEIKISAWAGLTLLLAQISGWISRFYYYKLPARKERRLQKIVSENHLENFVLEASYTQFPIIVTLASRKTYVGLCFGDELTNSEVESVAILPYLSGYRNKDDLTFEDTTNYWNHYQNEGIFDSTHEHLTLNDFRVILPRSEIESYAFFDIDTYIKFKENERKQKLAKLQGSPPVHVTGFTIRP